MSGTSSSSISLLSVYPVKINLLIDSSIVGEIVKVHPIDYLFQSQDTLKYAFSNISSVLNNIDILRLEDLPTESVIKFFPVMIFRILKITLYYNS